MKYKSKAIMLLKLKKLVNAVFALAFMMLLAASVSINARAAESADDYLPEGWTRIETGSLTDEEISAISAAICDVDETIQPKAPAPPLTSLEIIDLAVDENEEIHVVTREIGTSKGGLRFVYWNGSQCSENIYETQHLVGTDRIVYGYIRYFHTGIYTDTFIRGATVRITASSKNAMSPWNTLTASAVFELPQNY